MALFLAGPRPTSRAESNGWRQTRQWQQGIAFDLISSLHSLPELWTKQHLSIPWQLLLFPCACACPEHSHHSTTSQSELSGWWDAQKTSLSSLMMRYRICHNGTYGGGLSKLIKNWHVKSISKVNFQTDQWDDLIHQTATQTCARSRARPCSLQPSESHTTGTAQKRDNSHPVSSRGQDRGNEKVGQG